MRYSKINIDHLLPSVLKPARYCNNELNAFHKEPTEKIVSFCLAFPDVYEVGTSHLGIKILYTILNNENDAMSDRVYLPWPDLITLLEQENIPLFGIESRSPIQDFDFVGITLQTELTFTNVLLLLDSAKIARRSKERKETDPIIIAGGPCASNPEPLAPFIDIFMIGDGEEAIVEMKNIFLQNKDKSRKEKLLALAQIPGVYVPQFYEYKEGNIIAIETVPSTIEIRKFMDFSSNKKAHNNQLIPWMKSTHDRYVQEIMRGCSRGCRFCHAGLFYRPVREKDPKVIVDNLVKEVQQFGWEETALTSLSSSDYTCIRPVLNEIHKRIQNHKAKLSLPSLRVDSLDAPLLRLMNEFNSKGITIAPEAGSQRMRDVINKQISEEDILKGVQIALDNGWQLIKLYFMIGLPNETEEDVFAIVKLIEKIISLSGKKLKINVSVSPFVPKPFTPFQWEAMKSQEYLQNMAFELKNRIKKYRFVKLRYHEIQSSMLEAILTRGDRKTADLIEAAYLRGAKFDGWDEYFDFGIWQDAAKEINFDFLPYLGARAIDKTLPWEHINLGINRSFLLAEKKKAEQAIETPDCRDSVCSNCGVCNAEVFPIYATTFEPENQKIEPRKEAPQQKRLYYYRVFFQKKSPLTFISHLDLMRMIHRFIRVARLPLDYSEGYNPRPKISLGPPLSIGIEGEREYFDMAFFEKVDVTRDVLPILKVIFPDKLAILDAMFVRDRKMLHMDYYQFEDLELNVPEEIVSEIETKIADFYSKSEWRFSKMRKRKLRTIDLHLVIENMTLREQKLFVLKRLQGASIFDILAHVFGIPREETNNIKIVRKQLVHKNM